MGALGTVYGNGDFDLAHHSHVRRGRRDDPSGWGRRCRLGLRSGAELEESWTKARPLLEAIRSNARAGGVPVSLLALAASGRGLVDPDEAVIRADDEALLRGRAAFETLRVYGGRPFRLERISIGWRLRRALAYRRSSAFGYRFSPASSCRKPSAATRRAARLDGRAGGRTPRGWPCSARFPSGSSPRVSVVPARSRSSACEQPCRGCSGSQVHGLCGEHGRRGRGEASRRRRGGVRGRRRHRAGGHGHERVVATRRRARTPSLDLGILAGVTRATLIELAPACGYRWRRGVFAPRPARGRGGIHVLVRTRGHAAGRDRRSVARARPAADELSSRFASSQLRSAVDEKPVRLGGMALQNGVLVHGARRGRAPFATGRHPPRLFGPKAALRPGGAVSHADAARPIALAEAFALPMVRRALPRARFPFERPAVLGSIAATTVAARALRRSSLPAGARARCRRRGVRPGPSLASGTTSPHTTVPSTSRSVRTRTAAPAPKEHPRCGSQLIAPMVVSSLAANVVASRAPTGTRGVARARPRGRRGRLGRALLLGGGTPRTGLLERLPDPDSSSSGGSPGGRRSAARGRERGPRRLPRPRAAAFLTRPAHRRPLR